MAEPTADDRERAVAFAYRGITIDKLAAEFAAAREAGEGAVDEAMTSAQWRSEWRLHCDDEVELFYVVDPENLAENPIATGPTALAAVKNALESVKETK